MCANCRCCWIDSPPSISELLISTLLSADILVSSVDDHEKSPCSLQETNIAGPVFVGEIMH